MASNRCAGLLGFAAALLGTGALAKPTKATQDYAYNLNSVAITGGGYIPSIVAHPTEENLYYARTDIGRIVFMIFDPKREGTIYVGATVPGGLYYTTDSGSTWEIIPGQPASWNETSIAVNETSPPQSTAPQPMKAELAGNRVLYITYGDAPGPYGVQYGAVFAYDTHNQTWREITPQKGNVYPAPYEPQTFPVGGYCGISVSAQDLDTLVVASLDRDPGPAIDGIYLSRDGGKSWKDIAQLSTPDRESVYGFWGHTIEEAALENGTAVPWLSFEWSPPWDGYGAPSPVYGLTKIGWWMSAVVLSPWRSKSLMYATGATIWATDNLLPSIENDDAPDWYIKAQGIEETVTISMVSPTDGEAHLLSGEGDINGFAHKALDVPQPMFGLPVFQNLNSLDWAGQKQNVFVRTGVTHLENTPETGCHQGAYSTDAGEQWRTFGSCFPGVNSTSGDSGTIAIDASGKYLIWSNTASPNEEKDSAISNSSGPYYSRDMGKTWHSPAGIGSQTRDFSADRVGPGTFYSFTSGRWYTSRDGGASWSSSAAEDVGLPTGAELGGKPEVVFDKAGQIYLSLGEQGIYYTANAGKKWQKLTAAGVVPDLFTIGARSRGSKYPALFLYGIVESGPQHPGFYRSDDNGKTWVRVNDDQHQYGGPTLIQGDPRVYGRVFIGTGGRGIIRADLAAPLHVGEIVEGTGGI